MSSHPREHEHRLEPHELIRRSDAVLKAGTLMLGAGTSSRRVKAVMREVAEALGLDRLQAQVTFTEIVATVAWGGVFRTQVAEVTRPGVNAERIALLHTLPQRLRPGMGPGEVDALLRAIERRRPLYPGWLLTVLVALACCSICVLSSGGPAEVAAVFVASALAYGLHRLLAHLGVNLIASIALVAAAAAGAYLVLYRLAGTPDPQRLSAGLVASTIFLVPGFPLVTAGLDLARVDIEAGLTRLTYAAMVMASMGIGIWAVATAGGVSAAPAPAAALPVAALWGVRAAASFFAVLGWACMFNVPAPVAGASALIAIAGNAARLALMDAGVAVHLATFVGALVIGLVCHGVGWAFKLPVLIMTVPTLLVMIPGAPGLRALTLFNSGELMGALATGISVVLQAIAMVVGLAAAMMLTDPQWAFSRQDAS